MRLGIKNPDASLIHFAGSGLKGREYKVAERGSDVHQFVADPAGHKLFVLSDKKFYWVELP